MIRMPLFPLGEFVLFPRTHAPLHIFEDRYRAMIADVLEGDGRLGMAHLRPGYEKDYEGAPRIHRVITIARVLLQEKLEDGRYNLVVEGIERAEVLEEVDHEPYRIARVVPMSDDVKNIDSELLMREGTNLARIAEMIGAQVSPKTRPLQNMMNTYMHPGIVADVAASLLVYDPYDRQSILDETDVLRRVRLVSIQLQRILARINAGDVELPVADS